MAAIRQARRRWGCYVLSVLYGDRLVARVDARVERTEGVLRVETLTAEEGAAAGDVEAVHAELRSLAEWIGLDGVVFGKL